MATHPLTERFQACVSNANGDAKELRSLALALEHAKNALLFYADAGSYRLDDQVPLAVEQESSAEYCMEQSAAKLNELSCVQGVFEE